MTINTTGIDISTLMGSTSTSSGLNSLYSNLGQSKMIASGAYLGLLKNYYNNYSSDGSLKSSDSTSSSKLNSTGADDVKTSNRIMSSAENLTKSADALRDNKVYDKIKTKDENGNETEDYNYDDLYKKISAFVKDYNDVVDKAGDSNTRSVLSAASRMTNNTYANSAMLEKVGITVGSDNKLSVDEKAFRAADMSTLKTLFKGSGSFGYQTSLQASMIKSSAQAEATKTATYGSNGTYGTNYASSFTDFI